MKSNREIQLIQRSSWVGVIGNTILAILKIVVGVISNSTAVIADGIDSATDIVSSVVTLYASKASNSPPDKGHPWGHGRIETIATKVISIFIAFAGLQLIINTLGILFSGQVNEMPSKLALVVTIISILGKASMSFYKFKIASEINNSMVRADAIHMRNDIFISLGVLIGLIITEFANMPIVDPIIGLLLGILIMKSGIELSIEVSDELMDGVKGDEEVYLKVFEAVENTNGVSNPHKVRIRRINDLYDISLDVEVDGSITVLEGHLLAQEVEERINSLIPNVFDILIHIEPYGNCEVEQYGLNPKDFL